MSKSLKISSRVISMVECIVKEVVKELSIVYNFSEMEAVSKLNLFGGGSSGSSVSSKSLFPMPFSGVEDVLCCCALRQNQGLYTQCSNKRVVNNLCKGCNSKSIDGISEYGNISSRLEVGVYEFVDPKGRKPVHYTKIMSKYKVSESEVLSECNRLGIVVDKIHFLVPESDSVKRGRP